MTETPQILLVEDNPNDVELTLHAFQKHNLANEVRVARDGVEALDFLFGEGEYADRNVDEQPNLILLDLKMPKVGGLEVLRRLKADERTKAVPVVVLTSSREGHDVTAAYELGVNSYIVKPVEFQQFVEAARQLGLYWLVMNEPPTAGLRRASTT